MKIMVCKEKWFLLLNHLPGAVAVMAVAAALSRFKNETMQRELPRQSRKDERILKMGTFPIYDILNLIDSLTSYCSCMYNEILKLPNGKAFS